MKVKFHLPEFIGKHKFNLLFIAMLENCPHYFREGIEIASVYGVFPPSMWNGGRLQTKVCDKKTVSNVIKRFNDKGIPLRFTFTNPVLEKKHLNDDFCNMVLAMANNGLNEAIVVSPLLEDYIRKYYPKYKLTSSTCKRITDIDKLAEELEKDYSIVVVDYDLNNKFDLLEKLPNKDKCEFLVNSLCVPKCKHRVEHYERIGKKQIAYCNHIKKYPNVPFDFEKYDENENSPAFQCTKEEQYIYQIKNYPTHISPDDIYEKYLPMGFNQFKIEGRTANILNLLETYLYYMIKPEFIDEARFVFMDNLEDNGVITFSE